MADLLLNTDGDLDISSGLKVTNKRQEYLQRITLSLGLNLGEFFTHINYGLPWLKNKEVSQSENLRYFLGESFPDTESYIKTELDSYIKKFSFVSSIQSESTFEISNRVFTYNFTITTIEGLEISFPSYITTI